MLRRFALAFGALLVVSVACEAPAPKPEEAARSYADAWQRAGYAAMYDLLTPAAQRRTARDAFVTRYGNIADEMSLTGIDVSLGVATPEQDASQKPIDGRVDVPLTVRYKTTKIDPFTRTVALILVRQPDKSWKVDWTPEAIVPGLSGDRLVRMTRLAPTRGRIIARDGTELATFGDGFEVGVVPGQIKDEAAMLHSLAPLLALPETEIKKRYANGQPDWFMPIRVMPPSSSADARPSRVRTCSSRSTSPCNGRQRPRSRRNPRARWSSKIRAPARSSPSPRGRRSIRTPSRAATSPQRRATSATPRGRSSIA